ncbi:FMN reductase (NADH) NtaB [Aquimixticola soesokkakensis]|uniref:FMN reductase (NADH) NtaB n=1 Tax=Aquimixticola soesokkakensis TaxID=1519096 RepID=A0A1Y5RSS2_9RHOB|nr:flavin reductase family protein [Aquimixticola soesokkakensis]SLN24234.1 FMN reductase (NADH) NtaB [Aquimixticola soesokkakensis]
MGLAHIDETVFVPDATNTRLLRDAFGQFATGVTVVTARGPAGVVAMTANSFASVSLDPALVLWSPARASRRFEAFVQAAHFAIHIMGADQADLAFAIARHGPAVADAPMGENAEGVPILHHCLARFDCARHAVHAGGDHAIVVGAVVRASLRSGAPLAFFNGKVGRIEH